MPGKCLGVHLHSFLSIWKHGRSPSDLITFNRKFICISRTERDHSRSAFEPSGLFSCSMKRQIKPYNVHLELVDGTPRTQKIRRWNGRADHRKSISTLQLYINSRARIYNLWHWLNLVMRRRTQRSTSRLVWRIRYWPRDGREPGLVGCYFVLQWPLFWLHAEIKQWGTTKEVCRNCRESIIKYVFSFTWGLFQRSLLSSC